MSGVTAETTAPLLQGRYLLGDCIGSGGMGTVYRAEDIALGRTVAVKLMRGGEAEPAPSARAETAVLASLSHPSLVTLFDAHLGAGEAEFLVMELVDGPTLSERLRDGPLPPAQVAHLAAELADALHVVHAAGIVHRDVKPSNVLLAPSASQGRPFHAKLADFGIAYLTDAARSTAPGMLVGTLAYLAPEQLRGVEPAPAADMYSLGLVLLEALTGERAFPDGSPAEIVAARHREPVLVPDSLPAGWRALLHRMLTDEPGARPSSLEVMREAESLAVREEPARTRMLPFSAGTAATAPLRSTPAHEPASAATPRRRGLAALTGAAAAFAVTAAAVGLWAFGAFDSPAPATRLPVVTEESTEPEVAPPSSEEQDETADDTPGDEAVPAGGGESEPRPDDAPNGSGGADKQAEAQQKAAEKAAEQAQKNAEKAAEQAKKNAEKANEQAQKNAGKPGQGDD